MSTTKKTRFHEVDLLRLIVIILLVAYHAFCPYRNAWPTVYQDLTIPSYKWLDWLFYITLLETFTLISGYLFGYQMVTKSGVKIKQLIITKFHRLLIPSILFSIAYLYILKDPSQNTLYENISSIFYGVGHMWYLPMLFSCFVVTWFFHRLHWKPYIVLILLFLLMSLDFSGFYLLARFAIRPYYLLFFYMGFCLKAYSFDPMPYATWKNILLSTVCSAVCFYIVIAFRLGGQISLLPVELPHVYVLLKATDFFRFFYTLPATAALYLFCMRIVYIKHITLPQRLVNLTGMCFGVYLFQQIILMYMYYHTPLPQHVSPYALPWIGFIVAMTLSLLLTKLTLSTRIGRWLMG
jgi:hypothetical protein